MITRIIFETSGMSPSKNSSFVKHITPRESSSLNFSLICSSDQGRLKVLTARTNPSNSRKPFSSFSANANASWRRFSATCFRFSISSSLASKSIKHWEKKENQFIICGNVCFLPGSGKKVQFFFEKKFHFQNHLWRNVSSPIDLCCQNSKYAWIS